MFDDVKGINYKASFKKSKDLYIQILSFLEDAWLHGI